MFKELIVDDVWIEGDIAFFNIYHPSYEDNVYISAKIKCARARGSFEYGYGLDVQNYKDVPVEHLVACGVALCQDVDGVVCKVGQVFNLSEQQQKDINRQLFNLAVDEKIKEITNG